MANIDLKKTTGLSLVFDGTGLECTESSTDYSRTDTVEIGDMRPQLLNSELSCPKIFYYVFKTIDRKSVLKRKNLRYDIFAIPPNLAGIEYVKTKAMTCENYPLLLEVAHGYISLIIQLDCDKDSGEEESKAMIIKLKKGEKFVIPPYWKFVMVNPRQATAVVSTIFSMKTYPQTIFDETRGAAYYIIRKNARQEVVQNPRFRNYKKLKPVKPESLYDNFNLTEKTPIFKQILRKYERFKWLHDSDKIEWDNLPGCN